jgi:hypothetical protein
VPKRAVESYAEARTRGPGKAQTRPERTIAAVEWDVAGR